MKQIFIVSPILLITLLFGFGCTSKVKDKRIPALFDSRIEAEKAAKNFNCTGAHRMGNKWMPCSTHEVHERTNDKHIKNTIIIIKT